MLFSLLSALSFVMPRSHGLCFRLCVGVLIDGIDYAKFG